MITSRIQQQFTTARLWALHALVFVFVTGTCAYGLIADGRGIFGVVVEVIDAKSREPLEGVTVALQDSGRDEVNANKDFKKFAPLFAATQTNPAGQTIAYYYGGYSFESGHGTTVGVRGTLKLVKVGYEDVTLELRNVLGPSFKDDGNGHKSLPVAEVRMTKK